MLKKTLLCLLLSLSLLAGSSVQALGGGRYPEKEHLPVDYADMLPVTSFDETALLAALRELEGLCGRNDPKGTNAQTRSRIQELYEQILLEMNVLITKVSLSSVQYDASGGAPDEAVLYLELSSQQTRLFDRCYQSFGKLALSSYRDVLENNVGEGISQSLVGYEGMTEEDSSLREEEDQLVQTYDQIMSKGVPVLAEGSVWTWETLGSAEVDSQTYLAVSDALEAEQNRAAGEIYRELLQLRAEVARQAGFDNYANYAYWALYSRDYEPEDVDALREAAKEYILPLQLRLLEEIDQKELRSLDIRTRKTGEEIWDDVQPFIETFGQDMSEAFTFMREHHLYDVEYSAEKLPTGYTMALPAYGSAIIFNSPYGNYQDYSDLVHEFGHFNETFHCAQHDLWADFNIDVGEIDSQALELMFTSYAGELFGERYGNVYASIILYNILDSILDGCLYDEFQTAAYENPDLSVEELNRLFKELSEEYGYYYDAGVEEDSSWVENAHSFQSPLYFISYATSALSALDLWFLYLDTPKQAQEVYLDLSALSLSLPYQEAVKTVGLQDIFDPKTIPALATMLEDHLDGKSVSYSGKRSLSIDLDSVSLAVSAVFGPAIILIGVLCRVWRYKKSRREAQSWNQRDPWNANAEKPPWEL